MSKFVSSVVRHLLSDSWGTRLKKTFICRFIILFLYITAVASAPKEHKGTNWYITAVATIIILLFVVALCVYAPCGCLWRRYRSDFDVNCPITASQKGMCSKCYLHSNAATKKMTYEERPHHVNVTMATNDRQHRPSSGNFSTQVNIIADIWQLFHSEV